MEDEINKLIETMDNSLNMMGKTNLFQVAVNLTVCGINTKQTPEEIVDYFYKTMKCLAEKGVRW